MFGGTADLIKVQFMMFMGYAYIKGDQEEAAERRREREEDCDTREDWEIFYDDHL